MRLGLFWFVFVEGWMNSKEDEAVSGSQLRSRTGKMIIKAKRERKTLLRCFHERRLFPIHLDARTRLWNHNGSRESCGRRWLGGKIISLLNVHLNAFFFLPSSGGDQVCGSRPDGPSRFVSSKTRGFFFPFIPPEKDNLSLVSWLLLPATAVTFRWRRRKEKSRCSGSEIPR